jgi:hypothetical protein
MKANLVLITIVACVVSSCGDKRGYSYRSEHANISRKPVADVEKAWMARYKYDHERRLLIPMVGGTRWGATQEYKEDGTLEYRDWWVRDIKKKPIALISQETSSEGIIEPKVSPSEALEETPDAFGVGDNSSQDVAVPVSTEVPSFEDSAMPQENIFDAVPESTPAFPPSVAPFEPLPDALPPLELPSSEEGGISPDPFGL